MYASAPTSAVKFLMGYERMSWKKVGKLDQAPLAPTLVDDICQGVFSPNSVVTQVFFWGGRDKRNFGGGKICYFCHFYAKIVKYGIILTHLSLFTWDKRGYWGECPCGNVTTPIGELYIYISTGNLIVEIICLYIVKQLKHIFCNINIIT